jgi:hypothetical protein
MNEAAANVRIGAISTAETYGGSWLRPAIRVEWGTMAFGQSGVPMLNDVA